MAKKTTLGGVFVLTVRVAPQLGSSWNPSELKRPVNDRSGSRFPVHRRGGDERESAIFFVKSPVHQIVQLAVAAPEHVH